MSAHENGDGGPDATVMIPVGKPLLKILAEDWSPPVQLHVSIGEDGPELVFRLCNLDKYADRNR